MICENCNQEHDGSYGSGRFCNTSCAASFSSLCKNDERKRKIAESMKAKGPRYQHLPIEIRRNMTKSATKAHQKKREEFYKTASWDELPHSMKRRRVFEEQNSKCAICGINEWIGKPLTLHFDHIDGNKENESRENVRFTCPNCHSQTKTYCGNKQNLPEFSHLKITKERLMKG